MNPQSKFIVWDWNGTLQDDLHVAHKCMNLCLERLGKPLVDEHKYRESFDIPITNLYRSVGFTDYDMEHHLAGAQESFYKDFAEHVVTVGFREGANEILDYAKNNNIGQVILSNHQVTQIAEDLARHGIRNHFYEILAQTDRSAHRQTLKGDFLAEFIKKHALQPQNGLIIGDTAEETHIGHQLGLLTIAITGGYASERRLMEANPDHLIHSLRELLPILEQRKAA